MKGGWGLFGSVCCHVLLEIDLNGIGCFVEFGLNFKYVPKFYVIIFDVFDEYGVLFNFVVIN